MRRVELLVMYSVGNDISNSFVRCLFPQFDVCTYTCVSKYTCESATPFLLLSNLQTHLSTPLDSLDPIFTRPRAEDDRMTASHPHAIIMSFFLLQTFSIT